MALEEKRARSVEATQIGSLYEICNTIDFSKIEFLKPTHPVRKDLKARNFGELLVTANSCISCEQVVKFCYGWKSPKQGDFASLTARDPLDVAEDPLIIFRNFQINSQDVDSHNQPLASMVYLSVNLYIFKPGSIARENCGSAACSRGVRPIQGR